MKDTSHRMTGSFMADRPPAPLPRGCRFTSKLSELKEHSLSGSYEEPRQWMVPLRHQFPVESEKVPCTVNKTKQVDRPVLASANGDSGSSKLEIPAVPQSSPPSAADYAVVSAKAEPSGGYITIRASTLSSPASPVNGAASSDVTGKRRCQTLSLAKGKAHASLGISWAQGKADSRNEEGSPLPDMCSSSKSAYIILYCISCHIIVLLLTASIIGYSLCVLHPSLLQQRSRTVAVPRAV